jgi:hypothetical protein
MMTQLLNGELKQITQEFSYVVLVLFAAAV